MRFAENEIPVRGGVMEKAFISMQQVIRSSPHPSNIQEQRQLRASSYTIYVDLPNNEEEVLLVHGYSGAYDLVSQKIATYVRSLEVRPPPRPLYGAWTPEIQKEEPVECPSPAIIDTLKRRGYLTEKTLEEEEAFFVKIANLYHSKALRAAPSYVLMTTYDCNLRCSYCFQDYMRTNSSYNHLLRSMTRSMIDRIFTGILDIECQHDLPPLDQYVRSFTLFGGEPLLARNRRVIDAIVQKAFSIGKATFYAVSNGTELEIYQDLLHPDCISSLQITLDGPAMEHNKRRIYADGSGSFGKIAKNITILLEQKVHVKLRMNIDRINIQFLPQLLEDFVMRGWDKSPYFLAYTAPVHVSNSNTDRKTTFDTWSLEKALEQLSQEYPVMQIVHHPDDPLKKRARQLIEGQGNPMLHAHFCGAHSGMYVIDPFANVYACWERTGDERIRIGHISPDGRYQVESQISEMWRSRNVTTNKICRQCRYALNCGGGCALMVERGEGKIFGNHCDGYAARFRASVANAYLEFTASTQTATQFESVCDR